MDDSRHSSPNAKEDTDGYDGDAEMTSQDSETDTASSPTETSLDDKTDECLSSSSSEEAITNGASGFSGKNKNESSNNIYTPMQFPEIVICDVCYKRFSDKEQLCIHKSIQSPPITYSCEECGHQFETECTFEHHKSFEHTPKLFSSD